MRIQASVGHAPRTVSLKDKCYKLTLTATSEGEKQFLAGLHQAVREKLDFSPCVLHGRTPRLTIAKFREKRAQS